MPRMMNRQAMNAQMLANLQAEVNSALGLNTSPYSSYRPNVIDPLGISTPTHQRQGIQFRYGTAATPADIQQLAAQRGMLAAPPQRSTPGSAGQRGGSNVGLPSQQYAQQQAAMGEQLVQQIIAEELAGRRDAKQANIDRYNEAYDIADAVGGLNQQDIDNAYRAQETLNAEAARTRLGATNQQLAQMGLFNSTNRTAAANRNARDLTLVQQDLAERRGELRRGYLSRDSDRLLGIIERRNDTATPIETIVGVLNQMGRGGNGQGSPEIQAQIDELEARINRRDGRGDGYVLPPLPGPQGRPPMFVDLFGVGGGMPGPAIPAAAMAQRAPATQDSGQRRPPVQSAASTRRLQQKLARRADRMRRRDEEILTPPPRRRRNIDLTERAYV